MKGILRQSSWLVMAQMLTRAIGFVYTIFIARSLGVSGFGLVTTALSYFAIISSITDLGFNRYIVREVARGQLKPTELLWNVILLRLTLTALVFGIFSFGLYLLDPDKMRVYLTLLATLAILPQSVALTMDAIFIGMRKLQFSAIAIVISYVTTTLLGFYLVINGFGAIGVINALIFGQVIYVLILTFLLFKHKVLSLSAVTLPFLKKAVIGSLPYGLLGILGLLYFRIDALMLSYIKGNYETGLYGAAYRFLEAVIFIPGAFGSALFPIMAKLHDTNIPQIKKIYFSSLKFMFFIGIISALGFALILPVLFNVFLPNYVSSVDILRILSLSLPFIFMATPGVQLLLSSEKYLKEVIGISIFTVVLNVVLNLIYIPVFGIFAAAWITVISDISSFIIFFLFIKLKLLK